MTEFLKKKLSRYRAERNEPDLDATSGFSPFLHFGHLSIHEVFVELARREKWKPEKLGLRTNGSRDGWWNMSPSADRFLDQLITWREVGYNFAAHREDYDRYESLPDWVEKTLSEHARDERDQLYSLEEIWSCTNTRPSLECGTDTAGKRRSHPQLPADAVGKENPAVDSHTAECRGDHDPSEQ